MSGSVSIQSHDGGHGGYRQLKAYQNAEIIADATFEFCNRHLDRRSRTHDQMVQAARSGKQNIGEGSMASATSAKTELHLTNVALGSLEELRLDYEDYLRQHGLAVWLKDSPCALAVRALAYVCDRSFATYRPYFDASAESAADALLCLIIRPPTCSFICWTSSWRSSKTTAALRNSYIACGNRREWTTGRMPATGDARRTIGTLGTIGTIRTGSGEVLPVS
jgi:four helix bundle protein